MAEHNQHAGDPSMTDLIADLAADLPFALERGEIAAHFQQQIDVASGSVVAAEALCRWTHPQLGAIPADVFVPLAERSGYVRELGLFMLRAGWELAARLDVDVSVNVSPIELSDEESCARLLREIDDLAVVPGRLTLEVTEAIEIRNIDMVVSCLEKIRERGIGVSVDDFGSGHASTELLLRLPATEVKLDRTLTQSSGIAVTAQIMDAMAIAAARGLRVVAEGVETPEHLKHVRALGCHRAQGFLFGTPMSAAAFEASLPLR